MECRSCTLSLIVCWVLMGTSVAPMALAQPARTGGLRRGSSLNNAPAVTQAVLTEDHDGNEICNQCGLDLVQCVCCESAGRGYCDPGCDCVGCCDQVGCGDSVGCPSVGCWAVSAGFEAVIVKPHYSDNLAYSVRDSDNGTFDSYRDVEFNYSTEFTPRVWIELATGSNVGWRCTWWQFDHSAAVASDSPPVNGFGEITHPAFRDVDISSTILTDVFTAATSLNAYTIDLDAVHAASFNSWELGVGCGVRYAFAEQSYLARLRDDEDSLIGEIDYRHSLEGIGPTILLEARRHCTAQWALFCKARGSALFGTGESRLDALEDLAPDDFTTTAVTSRDDVLSIGEVQAGVSWRGVAYRGQVFQPYLSVALEGQVWNGAGNASSEDGTLGFFGLNAGVGGTF